MPNVTALVAAARGGRTHGKPTRRARVGSAPTVGGTPTAADASSPATLGARQGRKNHGPSVVTASAVAARPRRRGQPYSQPPPRWLSVVLNFQGLMPVDHGGWARPTIVHCAVPVQRSLLRRWLCWASFPASSPDGAPEARVLARRLCRGGDFARGVAQRGHSPVGCHGVLHHQLAAVDLVLI